MAKGIRETSSQIRTIIIEEPRQIEPFNDRARNLSILNKPLWLFQRETLEAVLGHRWQEEPPVDALDAIPPDDDNLPILAHGEDLFFDEAYFETFWEQAHQKDRPCQAAFRADDRAFVNYAVPLTDRKKIAPDQDTGGRDIYRVPLWYLPHGVPDEGIPATRFEPIIIDSDYRELGYYSVPSYMSTELGDLVHLLPMRSMLVIESWVHIYYANVLFGVFALGSRLEERMNRSWLLRLRTLARAMLEQKQVLSCSELVKVGRNCQIDPSAVLQNRVIIGDNVVIEAGAVVVNSMIGSNTTIGQDCHIFLSIVGEGCFLPFKASLFMSVFMENSIVAQNTCLQMAVVGRNSFVGSGNTFTDFMMLPQLTQAELQAMGVMNPNATSPAMDSTNLDRSFERTLRAKGPNGLEPTGQIVLGGCVGHNCRIGAGMIIHPARTIESDVILIATPERRVIMRDVTYEESDHHKFPRARADLHPRMYPRADEAKGKGEEW